MYCIKAQHPWTVGTLGELTIILRSIIWRRRTVCVGEGSWIEEVWARVGCGWQACYRSEHSAWRNPAIGHIPVQGEVPGFFGHLDGDDESMNKGLKERREQKEVLLYKKWGRNSDEVVLAYGW